MGRAISKFSRTLGFSEPNTSFCALNVLGTRTSALSAEPAIQQQNTTIDQLSGNVPITPLPSRLANEFGLNDTNEFNNHNLRRRPSNELQQRGKRKGQKLPSRRLNISPNMAKRLDGSTKQRNRRRDQSSRAQPRSFNIEKRQIYLPEVNNGITERNIVPLINNNVKRRPPRHLLDSTDKQRIVRTSSRQTTIPQRLYDLLQCPVCLNEYVDPHFIPCGHTYCYSCLNQLIQNNNILICPECRKKHIVPQEGFPSNFLVRNLIEENLHSISGKCTECKLFTVLRPCRHCGFMICDRCYQRHKDTKLAHRKSNSDISQSCIIDLPSQHLSLTKLNRQLSDLDGEKIIHLFVAVHKLLFDVSQVKQLIVAIPIANFLKDPSAVLTQRIAKRERLGVFDQLVLEYDGKRIRFNRTLHSYGIEDGDILYVYNNQQFGNQLTHLCDNDNTTRVVSPGRRNRNITNNTRNNVELLSYHSLNGDNLQTSSTSITGNSSDMSNGSHVYTQTSHSLSSPVFRLTKTLQST